MGDDRRPYYDFPLPRAFRAMFARERWRAIDLCPAGKRRPGGKRFNKSVFTQIKTA